MNTNNEEAKDGRARSVTALRKQFEGGKSSGDSNHDSNRDSNRNGNDDKSNYSSVADARSFFEDKSNDASSASSSSSSPNHRIETPTPTPSRNGTTKKRSEAQLLSGEGLQQTSAAESKAKSSPWNQPHLGEESPRMENSAVPNWRNCEEQTAAASSLSVKERTQILENPTPEVPSNMLESKENAPPVHDEHEHEHDHEAPPLPSSPHDELDVNKQDFQNNQEQLLSSPGTNNVKTGNRSPRRPSAASSSSSSSSSSRANSAVSNSSGTRLVEEVRKSYDGLCSGSSRTSTVKCMKLKQALRHLSDQVHDHSKRAELKGLLETLDDDDQPSKEQFKQVTCRILRECASKDGMKDVIHNMACLAFYLKLNKGEADAHAFVDSRLPEIAGSSGVQLELQKPGSEALARDLGDLVAYSTDLSTTMQHLDVKKAALRLISYMNVADLFLNFAVDDMQLKLITDLQKLVKDMDANANGEDARQVLRLAANQVEMLAFGGEFNFSAERHDDTATTDLKPQIGVSSLVAREATEGEVSTIASEHGKEMLRLLHETQMTGLSDPEFKIYWMSMKLQATLHRAQEIFLDAVFCFDRSFSMENEISQCHDMISAVLKEDVLDGDRFGVVAFNHEAETLLEPCRREFDNRVSAADVVHQVEAEGTTDIWGALREACSNLNTLRTSENRRRCIILLTDGAHTRNEYDLCTELANIPEDVAVFAIGFGPDHELDMLQFIANEGNRGGFYAYADPKQANQARIQLGNALASHRNNVARDVEVSISSEDASDWVQVLPHSSDIQHGSSSTFQAGNLGGGQQRDILALGLLRVPETKGDIPSLSCKIHDKSASSNWYFQCCFEMDDVIAPGKAWKVERGVILGKMGALLRKACICPAEHLVNLLDEVENFERDIQEYQDKHSRTVYQDPFTEKLRAITEELRKVVKSGTNDPASAIMRLSALYENVVSGAQNQSEQSLQNAGMFVA